MELSDLVAKVTFNQSMCMYMYVIIGVEKNNDDARRSYPSSNHLDPPREVLCTEARLTTLSHTRRNKRKYEKRDSEYWQSGILTKRAHTETN